LLDVLYQYTQIMRDVREAEETLMKKRSAAIQLETQLLGEELVLAAKRRTRAAMNISKVQAMRLSFKIDSSTQQPQVCHSNLFEI
jgi:hypothetical protein